MANSEPNATTVSPPSAAEVRAELVRVLGSTVFAQAGRSTEFLRFVVEETLQGRADRLKGYTIAIEVFGKPPEFDAQTDPLVRVEAGRLRRRLIEYYHAEGSDDTVRIALPKNGYAPTFTSLPAVSTPLTLPSASKVRRTNRKLLLRGAGARNKSGDFARACAIGARVGAWAEAARAAARQLERRCLARRGRGWHHRGDHPRARRVQHLRNREHDGACARVGRS